MKKLPVGFKPDAVYFPEHKPDDHLLPNGVDYVLQANYTCMLSGGGSIFRVTAKKGYVYNGFSVPSFGRFVQGKHDGAIEIALFHDLDYDCHWSNTQCNADWILLLGAVYRDYSWLRRNTMYTALVLGGWYSYPKSLGHIKEKSKYVTIEPSV